MTRKLLASLLLALFIPCVSFAVNPATGVYEIRASATANNVNGCGFNSDRAGTDYTLQDAAQLHSTDGVSTAATTFTSVTGGFTDAMKGNYLHLVSATGADEVVGWHEIVSVTNGTTLELSQTTGTYTAGDFYIGGACSMNSTLDDDMFESAVAGNIFYVRQAAGTVTAGEQISIAAAGGSQLPIQIIGYTTSRATVPTGTNRPTMAMGTSAHTLGANWNVYNVIFTGSGTSIWTLGASAVLSNNKFTNSGAAGRNAITGGANCTVRNNEFISTSGDGFEIANNPCVLTSNYFHDSDTGFRSTATNSFHVLAFNIFDTNATAAIAIAGAMTGRFFAFGNTIAGAATPAGIGVSFATGTTNPVLLNNIIWGNVTGVTHADAAGSTAGVSDYNNFYNNTTPRTNWPTGANDQAIDPSFTDSPNGNFAIGSALKALGFPGAFAGGLSTGYLDQGAVQRQESGGAGIIGQ